MSEGLKTMSKVLPRSTMNDHSNETEDTFQSPDNAGNSPNARRMGNKSTGGTGSLVKPSAFMNAGVTGSTGSGSPIHATGSPIHGSNQQSPVPSSTSVADLKLNFFRGKTTKVDSPQKKRHEDISISFFSLRFSNTEMEQRFLNQRRLKYRTRLKAGASATAFFIPFLVILQITFKSKDTGEKWTKVPLVLIFPGVVMCMGLLIIGMLNYFQTHPKYLSYVCLIAQVSALLDTTAAGTSVSERNVWVHFLFTLGITSSTGLAFIEALGVISGASMFFVILAWIRYAHNVHDGVDGETLSSPGTLSVAVILYCIFLAFLSWNWEYEERRDFVLTERLAKENVLVQMTMEMTGWFSGGAVDTVDGGGGVAAGVLSANTHIDPKDVEIKQELGQGTFGIVYAASWKETRVAVKKITLQGDTRAIITSFGAEASVMAQLRHPNVVMFMGVMVHPEFVGLVMELCPKGNVYTVIHTSDLIIDWSLLLRMVLDASRGMHFLHSATPPILHRDLKSLNLLIDSDWRCKVSDFGLSKLKAFRDDPINQVVQTGVDNKPPGIVTSSGKSVSNNNSTIMSTGRSTNADQTLTQNQNQNQNQTPNPNQTQNQGQSPSKKENSRVSKREKDPPPTNEDNKRVFIGSSIWIAPEIFKGESHTEKADVFSFGVILFETMARQVPYQSISIDAVPFVVQAGKRPTDFFRLESQKTKELVEFTQLMERCWAQEPKERPAFSNIISALQSIIQRYVGDEKWEDRIIFPDRRIMGKSKQVEAEDGLSIREEDLVVEGIIGKGVFGVVFKGTYFGTPVAIKKLHVSSVPKNTLAEFEKECNIMKGLHHPNIVLFMGSCSKPPTLLLVTELLANGSFFDIYHKSARPEAFQHMRLAFNIAFDMARGLAYLHNHNPIVIHRDLKSQNILLDDKMRTKIGDFGLSKFRDVGKTMSICGSPLWVAPEVLRGEKYGTPCDVYSFSIIVWEALAWSEPYPDMGSSDIMNGVACGNLRPVVPQETHTTLARLLEECWTKKQDQRPTFNEIVPRLEAIAKDFVRSTSTQ